MDHVSINNENNKYVIGLIKQIKNLIEKEDLENTMKLSELTSEYDKNRVLIEKSYDTKDSIEDSIRKMVQIRQTISEEIKNSLQELYNKHKELKETEQILKNEILANNTKTQEIEKELGIDTRDYTKQLLQLESNLPVLIKSIDELNKKKPVIEKKKEKYANFKIKINELSKHYNARFAAYTKVNEQLKDELPPDEKNKAINEQKDISDNLNKLYSEIISILSEISHNSAVVTNYRENEKNGNNELNVLFKNKYLKYKMKYITLKKQFI